MTWKITDMKWLSENGEGEKNEKCERYVQEMTDLHIKSDFHRFHYIGKTRSYEI